VLTILTFTESMIPEYTDDLDTTIKNKLGGNADLTAWKNNDQSSTFFTNYNKLNDEGKKKEVKRLVGDALFAVTGYGLKYGDAEKSRSFYLF